MANGYKYIFNLLQKNVWRYGVVVVIRAFFELNTDKSHPYSQYFQNNMCCWKLNMSLSLLCGSHFLLKPEKLILPAHSARVLPNRFKLLVT
jgi:hypothetical protein